MPSKKFDFDSNEYGYGNEQAEIVAALPDEEESIIVITALHFTVGGGCKVTFYTDEPLDDPEDPYPVPAAAEVVAGPYPIGFDMSANSPLADMGGSGIVLPHNPDGHFSSKRGLRVVTSHGARIVGSVTYRRLTRN